MLSDNTILSLFSKSGPWNKYSVRFHNLDKAQRSYAVSLIQQGNEPADAIRKAKNANAVKFAKSNRQPVPLVIGHNGMIV